jgi:hypothetical protein
MATIRTRAVFGAHTPRTGTPRTHAVEVRLVVRDGGFIEELVSPLCDVRPESLSDDPCATHEHLPPTCPTCAKRDPRARTGGAFMLSSLMSF